VLGFGLYVNTLIIILLIGAKIVNKYKNYCGKEGIIISRQVEKVMKKHLKKK